MMHKAWRSKEDMPYCYSRSAVIFKVTGDKNHRFWPELSISGLYFQFEFTDDFESMHKAWHNIEEMHFCFPMSSMKFQGHMGQKSSILTRIEGFQTVTLV